MKKIRISPIPLLQLFRFFCNCLWKTANAILKITYIRSTSITDQSKFIENLQYCKQTGKILDRKKHAKTSPGPKTDFLAQESEKSEKMVPNFEFFEKSIKDAPKQTVLNGSYTSPNELMRF